MLLNVLGLFLFETFTTTDVIQPCAVYEHGPKVVDQERTLNCFIPCQLLSQRFSRLFLAYFVPRKLPIGMCILMLWDIVERGKGLSCSSLEI